MSTGDNCSPVIPGCRDPHEPTISGFAMTVRATDRDGPPQRCVRLMKHLNALRTFQAVSG